MPDTLYRNAVEFLGGPMAAPVFMFCMGIGMVFTRRNTPEQFIRRGLKLWLSGYLLNFLRLTSMQLIGMTMGIELDFDLLGGFLLVDVLQFAGLSYLAVGLMRKWSVPNWIMLVIALLAQGAGIWFARVQIASIPLQAVVGLLFPTGFWTAFPLTTWFVIPVCGIIFAERVRRETDRTAFYRKLLILSGALFAGLTSGLLYAGEDLRMMYTIYEENYYILNLLRAVWTLLLVCMVLGACFFLFGRLNGTRAGSLARFGSSQLTKIYFAQWLLITYTNTVLVLMDLPKFSSPPVLVLTCAAFGIVALIQKVRTRKGKQQG